MSWFEFSVWTLLFWINDTCFIIWQRISSSFWYLLTQSNMTEFEDCIWWLITWDWWVKVFMLLPGLTVIQMQKNYWILLCPLVLWMLMTLVEEDQMITHVCDTVIFVNRAPNFVLLLKDRLQLRLWPAVQLLFLRTTAEMVEGLRYKLRVLGVPTDGPCDVFCDNAWVVPSASRPEDPSLRNKHCSYAYHKAKDWIAAGMNLNCLWRWQDQHCFLLTNIVIGTVLQFLVGCWMWRNQTKPPNMIKGKIPMLI